MDDGLDLPARADHARHGENARNVFFAVAGDLLEVEALEGDAEGVALQPNGSREQELGTRPERPCLCLSNEGLIEQTAKDALAEISSPLSTESPA